MRRHVAALAALTLALTVLFAAPAAADYDDWPYIEDWDTWDETREPFAYHPPAEGWCLPHQNIKVKVFLENFEPSDFDEFDVRSRISWNSPEPGIKWKAVHYVWSLPNDSKWYKVLTLTLPNGVQPLNVATESWVRWEGAVGSPVDIGATFRSFCV